MNWAITTKAGRSGPYRHDSVLDGQRSRSARSGKEIHPWAANLQRSLLEERPFEWKRDGLGTRKSLCQRPSTTGITHPITGMVWSPRQIAFPVPIAAERGGATYPYGKLAEREGFEPSIRCNPYTRFPGVLLQPLGHLSAIALLKHRRSIVLHLNSVRRP